jgi:3-oxoacyl-[acyl-carrier protein] reductase
MKQKDLSEQLALVTGGGSGIGRAMSFVLATNGASVVIASRREDLLQRTSDEINSKLGVERVFPQRCDIREETQIRALVEYAAERSGHIDVLINNSGLAVPETVESVTDEGWDRVMETNLKSVMHLVRLVLPLMIKNEFGDIVNISSQAGKHGYADVPSYCASKFGLLGYAEALRDHVRKIGANIRVFNFCPGLVDVENTGSDVAPRTGFIHVDNLARTLVYALSLSRNVVLEDINLYSR